MSNTNSTVSIVVCAHGLPEVTGQCLTALRAAADPVVREVILVDDGSPTPFRRETLPDPGVALRIIRNDNARGFLRATNRGAREATSDFLFLLNNDTRPQPGFCAQALQVFDRFHAVGFVAAKLVYPDGRLQEAGGVCFADGRTHHIGYGLAPTDYRFNFVRTVPYGSAAALLMRKATFDALGGFDEAYAPAYYEDLDLQLRARAEHGLRTYYQPLSVVIHDRGSSYGEKEGSQANALVARNKQRFLEHHRDMIPQLGYGAARLVFCLACPAPDDPALTLARPPAPDLACYLVPLTATPAEPLRQALTQAGWGVAMDQDAGVPLSMEALADRLPLHESLSRLFLPIPASGDDRHPLLTPETLYTAYRESARECARWRAFAQTPGIRFVNRCLQHRLFRSPAAQRVLRACAGAIPKKQ